MRYKKVNNYAKVFVLILISFFVFSNFASAGNKPSNPNFTKINEFECSWDKHTRFDHEKREITSYDLKDSDNFSVSELNSDSGIARMSPPFYNQVYYYKTDLFFKFFSFYSNKNAKLETGKNFDLVVFNESDQKNNYIATYTTNWFNNKLEGLALKYGTVNITTRTHYGTCKAIKRP